MKKTLFITLLSLLTACSSAPPETEKTGEEPSIYPDYVGVTIPVGIAPMNFCLVDERIDKIYVTARGSKGGVITAKGDHADFNINRWHRLTERNKGGDIIFTVKAKIEGRWIQYDDFVMHVSDYPLEEYGVTYRRISPGYEVGGFIGIYERDLSGFNERPLLLESAAEGRCFNCHTPLATNPDRFTLQARGATGGTLIQIDGRQEWIDTKTDSTRAAVSYAYWHPGGRYIAYTTSEVHQSFFVGRGKPLEVYHLFSDIVIYDTETHTLILDSLFATPSSLEIFPAFSSDGKTMYYSSSKACRVPAEYMKVKCSLCAISFDAATETFGEKVDTLLNGPADDKSYVLARPSYDGRWLMYVRCSRSNFPIAQQDADLWLMDMTTGATRALDEVNSDDTESYPNWNINSHWFVFSSKREDGMYTKLYLSCLTDDGRAGKPFLLPQRDPRDYYSRMLQAYNTPDFTKSRVNFDAHEAARQIMLPDKRHVTIK